MEGLRVQSHPNNAGIHYIANFILLEPILLRSEIKHAVIFIIPPLRDGA
jgi:hypothetical protein